MRILGPFGAVILLGASLVRPAAQPASVAASACSFAIGSSGPSKQLVASANHLGFGLFSKLVAAKPRDNVFISPTSAAIELYMLYGAAGGTTRQEMAKALSLQGLNQTQLLHMAAAMIATLRSSHDPHVQVDIANSLWYRQGVHVNPAFAQNLRHYYGALVSSFSRDQQTAVNQINGWVACATHGKITSVLKSIPATILLYLINGTYFHGDWTAPFNPVYTRNTPFQLPNGRSKQVGMMLAQGSYLYYAGSDFVAVRLPFGKGRFGLDIVVPTSTLSLPAFIRRHPIRGWQGMMSHTTKTSLHRLGLPRFSLSREYDLRPVLGSLGIRTGSVTGICATCHVDDIVQKTYLKVNEKGTTAVAVTISNVSRVDTSPSVIVSRPFLLGISDKSTGSLLFLGAMNNPDSDLVHPKSH